MVSNMKCECGSTEFRVDEVHLELVCIKCGLVIDDNYEYNITKEYKPQTEKLGGYSRK